MPFEEEVKDVVEAADTVAKSWKSWVIIGLVLAGLVIGGYAVYRVIF